MSSNSPPPSRSASAAPSNRPRQFASDNRSGICPEAWQALQRANDRHAPSYGDDDWTRQAADLLRLTFQSDCDVYFTATGTAANSLALAAMCQSYHSVICHEYAHVETDECGAPEFYSNGTKILLAPGSDGKIAPEPLETLINRRSDIHFPKPRVVSVTQATELGTVYTPEELRVLCDVAHRHAMHVHMDGARFANAVAALGCAPADITWKAGIDVLCFGGTKNGMLCAEAVIFFDRGLSTEFAYRCKQAGQLLSKMRFVAAQWVGALQPGTPGGALAQGHPPEAPWLVHARHTNAMARELEGLLRDIPGIRLLHPVQANALFVHVPPAIQAGLRARGWEFYTFIGDAGVRFMCSWDTTRRDIEDLAADLRDLAGGGR